MAPRRVARLRRYAVWLPYLPALAVMAVYAWGLARHGWHVASFPYQIDYGEAPELNRAMLISRGRQVYVDWSHPPYQMANYTPLYPALAALGGRLGGAQFFTGRLISFISTLTVGPLLAVSARALGAGWPGAAAAGLLAYAAYPAWNWGAFQRVDSLAVCLELLGLAVFCAGWVRRRRAWAVWATVPLFVAAAFTRQTVAAGALACYAYLLFRRPRLALGAIAAYAGTGAAIFGILQVTSGGQLWRHIVGGNLNVWSWERVDTFWQPFWRTLHWVFPLAAVGVAGDAARRQAQLPLLYALASAATALTIGKIGSEVNYLLQLWASLALLAGLGVGHLASLWGSVARPRWRPEVRAGAVAGALVANFVAGGWLLIGLQQAYHVPYTQEGNTVTSDGSRSSRVLGQLGFPAWPLWRLDPWGRPGSEVVATFRQRYRADPSPTDRRSAAAAQAYVARLDGDVLSEDMSFTVTTGKRIYVQPFEFTQLAEQGDWNQEALVDDVRRQRFVAVVLRFRLGTDPGFHAQRLNAAMLSALMDAYRLDASFGSYYLYRPR